MSTVTTLNDVLTAISTVGFPIVCCGVLFYQNWKEDTAHKEEVSQLTKAIENNTLVIQKMITLLEVKE